MGRCFDHKGIAGKVAAAGRWIEIADPDQWEILERTDLQSRMHWIQIINPDQVFQAIAGRPVPVECAAADEQTNLPQS